MAEGSMEKIRWSAKVRPELIERVYRDDASGVPDELRIDDLGIRLLLRCGSVLRAMRGDVECPRCGREFNVEKRSEEDPQGVAACPALCGWRTSAQQYRENKRHRELNGAESIVKTFGTFVAEYPRYRTAREKLLRIDRLIHEFHWDGKLSLPNRSVGNNLIEGSDAQVMAFLDALSGLDPERKQRWREAVVVMRKRRRGQLGPPQARSEE